MPSTNRERLLEAIQNIQHAPGSGDEIVSLALKLSSTFQQSGLTIDQIIDEIKAVVPTRPQTEPLPIVTFR